MIEDEFDPGKLQIAIDLVEESGMTGQAYWLRRLVAVHAETIRERESEKTRAIEAFEKSPMRPAALIKALPIWLDDPATRLPGLKLWMGTSWFPDSIELTLSAKGIRTAAAKILEPDDQARLSGEGPDSMAAALEELDELYDTLEYAKQEADEARKKRERKAAREKAKKSKKGDGGPAS